MGFELDQDLQNHQTAGLYRTRKTLETPQQPEVMIDGQPYLAFCSNDYLGLANHPDIINSFKNATNEYGVGGGAAHLVIGHSQPHHQLEEELAAFTGRDRALLFSSGYMANLGAISALLNKQDAAFEDRLNHASLLDAGQLSGARFQRYLHRDVDNLRNRLQKSNARRKLIITDGVFSMDGDIAPVKQLSDLAQQQDAWLMVDDAHGFGVLGETGGGVAQAYNMNQQQLPVLMGTLGKGFGTYGAFVAGSEALIETIIQFARTYIYTTSAPPAVAEATRTSLKIVQKESWRREQLQDLIAYFRKGCDQLGLPVMDSQTPIQPLMIGCEKQAMVVSQKLAEQHILVTAIRPPTVPKGSSRLRVTFSASHTRQHVDSLLNALEKAMPDTLHRPCNQEASQKELLNSGVIAG